ncbi:MAG: SDR family NAD(P)-dependent oxidoreductase [Parvibaculales bacterium]
MDLGLKGLKVILTGGSRGIGRAALELFAQEGCDIGFFSRNPEQVAETVDSLSKHGGKVIGEAFDMENAEDYAPWLSKTADALGGCDIFIPGVSVSGAGATTDWDKCLQYDLKGAFEGCDALQPYLEKSDHASIVIMSSTAAVETFMVPQPYNAAKAALLTYAKQLSQHLGAQNIRVNAVSPGPISFPGGNWEVIKEQMPELYESTLAQMALGRFGNAEDVANAMVFLASPAASYITGTNIIVDGGYTKRVQF